MRASGLQMLLALCRLPMIGWHLGRAGTLGHLARVSMLPIWMRRICRLADMMVRSRSARSDAGAALAEALIRLGPGFISQRAGAGGQRLAYVEGEKGNMDFIFFALFSL